MFKLGEQENMYMGEGRMGRESAQLYTGWKDAHKTN